jgi:hypothetical protein
LKKIKNHFLHRWLGNSLFFKENNQLKFIYYSENSIKYNTHYIEKPLFMGKRIK